MDFSGEVKTEMILKESLRLGKNLWLPRVNGDIMDFFRVRSKDDFEIGAYGILEPKGESKAGKEEARDGFMVVPGVAFDADRNRIGFGGGYYDKYLELYPELFTAAVAFGFQIVEGVPTEANDIRPQIMNLPKDPMLLLSVVNTKLRDQYTSLDALCEDMQADREKMETKLQNIDYTYDENTNQFV